MSEAQRAENRGRGGVLGELASVPSPPAMGSGERCKLPQRGLRRSPSRNRILAHLVLTLVPSTVFLRRLPATGGGKNTPQAYLEF